MKQETPTVMKVESKISSIPSRLIRAASSKAKNSAKPEIVNGNGNGNGVSVSVLVVPSLKATRPPPLDAQKTRRRGSSSLVLSDPKSGSGETVGSQKVEEEEEEVKAVSRSVNRPAVEQFARPTRLRLTDPIHSRKKKMEVDLDGRKKELQVQDQNQTLIRNLQSEVLGLKAELDKAQNLNLELRSHNRKLSEDLAAAQGKITALTAPGQEELVAEYGSPRFKDIQTLLANKSEHSIVRKEALTETSTTNTQSASALRHNVHVQRQVPECPSTAPLPPPPPPPPRSRTARTATTGKASPVVELYHSLPRCRGNKNAPVSSSQNSIVREFQNRSAHLLAIKSDIETKGELIDGLIQKVLSAAYVDIEDVLTFMDWLDNELSSLADEQAVLKHFKWPEKKADAMREAAIEYRIHKLLENEVSSYKDDSNAPCGVALNKMSALLDKLERSIQRLIKLRNSVMLSYHDHKIPTDWMLDSGIVTKIKQASIMLAKMYVKRVKVELESIQYSERESTQEALLIQGVHFAYRAHRFSGGLDSETLCAFEEIRQLVPGTLQGS